MKTISLEITGKISLPMSAQKVVKYLWDLNNLPLYEPRVKSVVVRRTSRREGTYHVRGSFAGIPWLAQFRYFRTSSGFVSEMIAGPRWPRMQRGFTVRQHDSRGCEVIHGERYELPAWMMPLCPLLQRIVGRTIRRELKNIERGLRSPSRPIRRAL